MKLIFLWNSNLSSTRRDKTKLMLNDSRGIDKIVQQTTCTTQKNEVSVTDFFSKCDQIRRKL